MSISLRTNRLEHLHPPSGVATEAHALGVTAERLGDTGRLTFPNGRAVTGRELRAAVALPYADRERYLREITGLPGLRLAELALFLDDLVEGSDAAGPLRGAEVVVPESIAGALSTSGRYGSATPGSLTLETRPPAASVPTPPPSAPRPPAPGPAATSIRASPPAKAAALAVVRRHAEGMVSHLERSHAAGVRDASAIAHGWSTAGFGVGAEFTDALAGLTRDELRGELRACVARRFPAAMVDEHTDLIMRRLDEMHTLSPLVDMRDRVVAKMRETAREFEALYKDPVRCTELGALIASMESSSVAASRAGAADLRRGFGLEGVDLADAAAVTSALNARTAAIRAEAHRLASKGASTLPTAMAGLPHGETLLREALGVAPGSYLDERIAAALALGESDATRLEGVKFASSVVAGVGIGLLSAGAGLPAVAGYLLGAGTTAMSDLPDVLALTSAVEAERARMSGGVSTAAAVDAAEINRWVGLALIAVDVFGTGPAGDAAAKALSTTLAKHLSDRAADVATSVGIDTMLLAVEKTVGVEGGGEVGLNPPRRARVMAAAGAMRGMDAGKRVRFEAALHLACAEAGVPPDALTRSAVLTAYFAERGLPKGTTAESFERDLAAWLGRRPPAR